MPKPTKYRLRYMLSPRKKRVGQWNGVIYYSHKGLCKWFQWIEAEDKAVSAIKRIKNLTPVGNLTWVGINRYYRGRGYGSVALEQFVAWSRANKCRYVALEADLDRAQCSGFDLQKWYETRGFRRVGGARGDKHCVMIKKL